MTSKYNHDDESDPDKDFYRNPQDLIDYDENMNLCGCYESDTDFRHPAMNLEWEDYSDVGNSQICEDCFGENINFNSTAIPSSVYGNTYKPLEPQPNMLDTTDICVIAGTELDNTSSEGQEELLQKMWLCAKPPARMTVKKPLVTARQLEIVRAQLTGELPRKLRANFVKCDEETCEQICKYVGIRKARKNGRERPDNMF